MAVDDTATTCPRDHRFARRCWLCGSTPSVAGKAVPKELATAYRLGSISAVIEVIATNRSLYAKQIRWISGEIT